MSKSTDNRRHPWQARRWTRWLAVPVAAAVSLLAAACGPNSAAGGSGGKVITVGGVFPRTGALSANSVGAYESAAAFFKNVNAHGGIDGYTFRFIGLDDQNNVSQAASDYRQLIHQDGAEILIDGDDTTFPGAYTAVKGSGVPIIGCIGSAPCYQNADMYPIAAFQEAAIPASATSYYKANHVRKVDLVTINIPNAVIGASLAKQALTRAGIQVPLSTTFDPTTVDFTALVARAKASGATNIIFAANAATQLVPFVQAEIQQGYKGQLFGPGYETAWPKQLGAGGSGLVVMQPSAPVYGAGQAGDNAAATVRKYFPSVDLLSDYVGVESWVASEAIVQAVKDVAGTKSAVTSTSLIKALNGFKNWQGTFNAPLTWGSGPNGNPTHCAQNLEILGGKWTPLSGKRFNCWPASVSTAPPAS